MNSVTKRVLTELCIRAGTVHAAHEMQVATAHMNSNYSVILINQESLIVKQL